MGAASADGAGQLGPKLGAGREAEVYAWDDAGVLKLYHPGFEGHAAETVALRSLDGSGIAPKLLDVVVHSGRTGLVLERYDAPDMLTVLQRRPWQMLGLARVLATTQLAINRAPAPAGLPDLRHILAGRIQDAALPAHLRDLAMRVLGRLPDGDRLCHGDYHPGNLLLAADRTAVIDWAGATRGVPEADHARTILLLRWAEPLPGMPLLSRALVAAGRWLLAHRYTRVYRDGFAPRQLDAWLLVQAAARLSEGIDAERTTLMRLLERARHTGP